MESTILLVDDVRLFLEIQKEFLQYTSMQVMTAGNGLEALRAIDGKRPDLIFMDLEMPEMDGIACCRTIKANPQLAGIPVVMITAKGDEASQDQCRAAGCDGFLTKPLNRSLFLETAGRFVINLDRREKRRPIKLPGVLRSRGTTASCTLHDLSVGGAYIATDFSGEADRVIELSFTLPDGTTQQCRGKIIWSKGPGTGTPPGFGVSFLLLPASAKQAISDFLHP